jgi:hypothetical protein
LSRALHPNLAQVLQRSTAPSIRTRCDLLSVDVDVSTYLPPDTISHGFDNVADSQTFSPTLMDGYLRAASQISRLAVGDRHASATSTTYKIPRAASQMRRVDAPRWRRGGTSVVHVPGRRPLSPKASPYRPWAGWRAATPRPPTTWNGRVLVNGERVAISTSTRMSGPIKNGLSWSRRCTQRPPQQVTAAFIRLDGPVDDLLIPLERTLADVSTAGASRCCRTCATSSLSDRITGVDAQPPEDFLVPTAKAGRCAAGIIRRLTTGLVPVARGPPGCDEVHEQGRRPAAP